MNYTKVIPRNSKPKNRIRREPNWGKGRWLRNGKYWVSIITKKEQEDCWIRARALNRWWKFSSGFSQTRAIKKKKSNKAPRGLHSMETRWRVPVVVAYDQGANLCVSGLDNVVFFKIKITFLHPQGLDYSLFGPWTLSINQFYPYSTHCGTGFRATSKSHRVEGRSIRLGVA